MSDSTLPPRYRKVEPPKPKTVSDMQIGDNGCISPNAIKFDEKWRAWINPNAVLAGLEEQSRLIVVSRVPNGYKLNFLPSFNVLGASQVNDLADASFEESDFILACSVD